MVHKCDNSLRNHTTISPCITISVTCVGYLIFNLITYISDENVLEVVIKVRVIRYKNVRIECSSLVKRDLILPNYFNYILKCLVAE